MRESGGGDHVSVGMRRPGGEYERPIRGTRLFWTKQGHIAVCPYFTTDYVSFSRLRSCLTSYMITFRFVTWFLYFVLFLLYFLSCSKFIVPE